MLYQFSLGRRSLVFVTDDSENSYGTFLEHRNKQHHIQSCLGHLCEILLVWNPARSSETRLKQSLAVVSRFLLRNKMTMMNMMMMMMYLQ